MKKWIRRIDFWDVVFFACLPFLAVIFIVVVFCYFIPYAFIVPLPMMKKIQTNGYSWATWKDIKLLTGRSTHDVTSLLTLHSKSDGFFECRLRKPDVVERIARLHKMNPPKTSAYPTLEPQVIYYEYRVRYTGGSGKRNLFMKFWNRMKLGVPVPLPA